MDNEEYDENESIDREFLSKCGKIRLDKLIKPGEDLDDKDIDYIKKQSDEIILLLKRDAFIPSCVFDIFIKALLVNNVSRLEHSIKNTESKINRIESELNVINDKIAYLLGRIVSIDARI